MLEQRLTAFARRLQPNFDKLSRLEQFGALVNATGLVYSSVFTIIGLVWFSLIFKPSVLAGHLPLVIAMLVIAQLLEYYQFYFLYDFGGGEAVDIAGSFGTVLLASVWLFGASGVLIQIITFPVVFIIARWRYRKLWQQARLTYVRNTLEQVATATVFTLLPLTVYELLGGSIPLAGMTSAAVWPALITAAVITLGHGLGPLPLLILLSSTSSLDDHIPLRVRLNFLFQIGFALLIELLLIVFSVLAAGLYVEGGLFFFLFFMAGVVLMAYVGTQLSRAVQASRRHSQELALLERFGRAVISTPSHKLDLSKLLNQHMSHMFTGGLLEIRLFPNQILLRVPAVMGEAPPEAWAWIAQQSPSQVYSFLRKSSVPWQAKPSEQGVLLAPIVDQERGVIIGAVWLAYPIIYRRALLSRRTAVQSLASEISSALHSVKVYERQVAFEKSQQELVIAGQIQSSFLPEALPALEGWQLTATLDPARETSGDFYDVIALPNGQWGLVVADVADKGTGAALFMALSRTLIRTYAFENPTAPEVVMAAANARILEDTRSDNKLFVTVFYGVLDPSTGLLLYANAGHNPGYVLHPNHQIDSLKRTGIPLGMMDTGKWRRESIQLESGATLVLYSDGVTEAQDEQAALFGDDRLLGLMRECAGQSAVDFQQAIVEALKQFMGAAPQADDITLMVLARG